MIRYNLYRFLKEELKNGSSDLVTRSSGQVVRNRIERDMGNEREGALISLDFSEIGVIDYSCADEIIAKLISRLIGEEYGDRYIVLVGLNEHQKENVEVALERKALSLIAEMRSGERVLLGSLNNYLKETLNVIHESGGITAGELSERLDLPPNTSGTRLLNLHRKRLVKRAPVKKEEGRFWVYTRLFK